MVAAVFKTAAISWLNWSDSLLGEVGWNRPLQQAQHGDLDGLRALTDAEDCYAAVQLVRKTQVATTQTLQSRQG